MSDIEDGEIIDSDAEDMTCLENEQKKASVEHLANETANRSAVWNQPRPQARTHFRPIKCPGLSDSEDESNSDEDDSPFASKYSKNYPAPTSRDAQFVNPLRQSNFMMVSSATNSKGDAKTATNEAVSGRIENPRKRRNLGVWGNVLQEQTLERTISSVAMEEKPVSDRDVESYNYMRAYDDPRQANHGAYEELDQEELKSDDGLSEGEPTEALVAKEAFGFIIDRDSRKRKRVKARLGKRSDNEKKQSVKDRLGERRGSGEGMSDGGDQSHTISDKETGERGEGSGQDDNGGGEMEASAQNVSSRLGERSYDKKKDRSHIRASPDDPIEELVDEIIYQLDEPKRMQPLFERVVETMGGKRALEILFMTEDLELSGGMYTLDGSRRRTPGGIFLFLVKSDNKLDKEQRDFIFGPVNEFRKKKKVPTATLR